MYQRHRDIFIPSLFLLIVFTWLSATPCKAAPRQDKFFTFALFSYTTNLSADDRALTLALNTILSYKLDAPDTLRPVPENEQGADAVDLDKLRAEDERYAVRISGQLKADVMITGQHKLSKNGQVLSEFRIAFIRNGKAEFKTQKTTLKRSATLALQKSLAAMLSDAVSPGTGKSTASLPYTANAEALRRFGQGLDAIERGKTADAFKALTAAQSADADFRDLDYFLGIYYAVEKFDYEKAIYYLGRVASGDSKDAGAQFWLGFTYYLQGATGQAIRAFETACRLKPFLPDAYVYLAMLYKDRGDYDKVEAYYKQALRFMPDSASLWYNLAGIQAQLGETAGSVASLRETFIRDCAAFLTLVRKDADFSKLWKKPEFTVLLHEFSGKCGK